MSWANDLARGDEVEEEWYQKLHGIFQQCAKTFGKDSRYDISVPELDTTIEIKLDEKCLDTGNIVIEYHHNKPSGILTSEADVWLFTTGEEDIWITRKNILKMILVEELKPASFTGPGDRYSKAVFLVPIDVVRRYSTHPPSQEKVQNKKSRHKNN